MRVGACPFRAVASSDSSIGSKIKEGAAAVAHGVGGVIEHLIEKILPAELIWEASSFEGKEDSEVLEIRGISLEEQRDVHRHGGVIFGTTGGWLTAASIDQGLQYVGLPSNWFVGVGTIAAFAAHSCIRVKDITNMMTSPNADVYYTIDEGDKKRGNLNEEGFEAFWSAYAPAGVLDKAAMEQMLKTIEAQQRPLDGFHTSLLNLIKYKFDTIPFEQGYNQALQISENPGTLTKEEHRLLLTSSYFFRQAHERKLARESAHASSSSREQIIADNSSQNRTVIFS